MKNVMKKYVLILACVVAVLSMGAYVETQRFGWNSPRGAVSSDDTLLTASATTMKYANIPTTAYWPAVGQNVVEVAWSMGADAESCVAYIFAARKNGDIVLVWYGTLTAGKQVSTDSRFWVDTIVTTTDNWITSVELVDEGGADRMSRVSFDTLGYSAFFCQYTGLSSESVKAYWSGF